MSDPNGELTPEQALDAQAAQEQGQAEESFFSWKDPTGNEVAFKSADELAAEMNRSFMQQRDYTQKTQGVAEERRKIQEREKELEDLMKRVDDKSKEFSQWDKFVSQRPDLYQYLQREYNRPPDPSVAYDRSKEYVDQTKTELEKKFEELAQWKEQMELQQERDAIVGRLKEQYPDFDPNAVDQQLQMMGEGGLQALLEAAYYAQRGRSGPAQEKQQAAAQAKAGARVLGKGGGSPPKQDAQYKNLDEAGEALKEAMRKGALDLGE